MTRQFITYVFVGILSAIVDIGTMQALIWLDFDYRIAVSVAFGIGLTFNYLCHERVTFRAKRSAGTIVRFGVLVLANYGLTLLCVHLSVANLDSVMVGKLVSLPLIAVNGFLWGRFWVFRK